MDQATQADGAPEGFSRVTEAEFFAALRADPRDILPDNRQPDGTTWKVQHDRQVRGVTTPGWKDPRKPRTYRLMDRALAANADAPAAPLPQRTVSVT